MRVCIVTPRYPPNTKGGGEISCSILARELSKYCDVEVISFDGDITSKSEIEGVEVTRIKACPLSASQSKIPINLQAFNYLKKRVKDYDIFHTYNMDLMPAVGLLTKLYGVRSVATLNGAVFSSQGEWYHKYKTSSDIRAKLVGIAFILRNKSMMPAIKNINYFTTLCPFYKERFGEDGIPLRKIKVIPNMLDPNFKVLAKRRNNKKVRILYMGHFRWRKGVDILLSAYSLLKKQNVELIIAGYGETILGYYGRNRRNFEQMVESLKIKNDVRFLERIPYEKVPELYSTVDIFVQPYRYPEPIGRTLLEALQSGVCVITTGNNHYSPIIKNMEHGVLIYPCTPEKLAEKMQMLIDNPDLRKKLAKNGQQRVWEVCAPQKIIPQYIEIYEKLKAAREN